MSLPLPAASWSRSLAELRAPRRVAWSPTLGYAHPDREVLDVCEAAVAQLEDMGTEVVVVDDVFARAPANHGLALVGVYCLRELEPFRGKDVWGRIDPGLLALVEWARSSVTATRMAEGIEACHTLNLALVGRFH